MKQNAQTQNEHIHGHAYIGSDGDHCRKYYNANNEKKMTVSFASYDL